MPTRFMFPSHPRAIAIHLAGLGLAFLSALQLGACGADVLGPPPDLRAELATPTWFTLDPGRSAGELTVTVDRGSSDFVRLVPVILERGSVVAAATPDGALRLDELDVAFAPMEVPPEIISGDVRLTHLRVHLAEPVRDPAPAWSPDGQTARADLTLPLALDWSMEIEGRDYPLGAQQLEGIRLAVTASIDGDVLALDLLGVADDVIWSWADIVIFRDLSVASHGATDIVVID